MTNKIGKKSHPLHMMLVHFPSALYPFSLLMELLGWYYDDAIYCNAALFALMGGVAGGILAVFSGAVELVKIKPDTKAWNIALWHAGLNILWLIVFGILLAIRFRGYPDIAISESWYLLIFLGTTIGMFASNYLGGELVVNHSIGINQSNSNKTN